MRLLILGVSHHTAPIDLRERLAFAAGDLADAVSTLARDPALGEVVLLSTCNRTQLYATCQSLEDGHEAMAGFLTTARAVPADDLRAHIYTRSEADAARHLFRVAAGLDSLVVGEPQILGQVKQAYASFAIAAVMGLTYVLLFRELKGRQPGVFYARLPSLATLDQMNGRAIVAGFTCLTAGMLIGLVWLMQANRAVPIDPRVDAMSMADPKILIAVGSWLLYAFQILARTMLGWSGKRTAWLSAAGFVVILVNLLPVAYLVPTSHAFD